VITGQHLAGRTNADVVNLIASNSRIQIVSPVFMNTFTNLQILSMNGSFTTVHQDSFPHCQSLRELYLDRNLIVQLPVGAFTGCNQLFYLEMDTNSLETINEGTFDGLNQLRILNLRLNWIRNLGQNSFRPLPNLEILNLNNNFIRTIHVQTFDMMTNLRELYLNNNLLMDLNPATSMLPLRNLRILDLSGNFLRTFTFGAHSLSMLETLDLNRNTFIAFDRDSFPASGMPNLQHLDLSFCQLIRLDTVNFQSMTNLLTLNIGVNTINIIQPGFFNTLTRITNLNAERNLCVNRTFNNIPAGDRSFIDSFQTCFDNYNDASSLRTFTAASLLFLAAIVKKLF